jgi:hypothetical protein
LSDSESEEEDLHFQFPDEFQFTQMKVKQMAIKFEPRIAKLFKQTYGTKIKLDLRKVILLDSQSTMDLICDPALAESTFKSSRSMRLKSNGRTMEVKKQAIMPGYHMHVWYNKKAITNILSLSNVIKQYFELLTTATIKCSWCIAIQKENRTWNFRCTRAGYVILIPETASLLSLILSLRIWQASQRGR